MKKVTILATVLALCGITGLASAVEDVDVDVTYVSKYLWYGFDKLDDKAAIQPSVTLDFGNGFYTGVWMSYAGAGGDLDNAWGASAVNSTEYRYFVGYGDSTCIGDAWQTDYTVNFRYYDFIDEPDNNRDTQEVYATLAWPNVIGNGLTPSYTIAKLWASESGAVHNDLSGWVHVVGLSYDMVVDGFSPDNPQQTIKLFADAVFNDGAGAGGVDHDWSHVTWGAKAPMKMGQGTLTPAIYYQSSMEDTVNSEDEFYGGISYSFSF